MTTGRPLSRYVRQKRRERLTGKIQAGTLNSSMILSDQTFHWDGSQWVDTKGNPHPEGLPPPKGT